MSQAVQKEKVLHGQLTAPAVQASPSLFSSPSLFYVNYQNWWLKLSLVYMTTKQLATEANFWFM